MRQTGCCKSFFRLRKGSPLSTTDFLIISRSGFQIRFSLTAQAALDRTCLFPCTYDYQPVCGNDLKTYPNECAMRGKACMNRTAIIAVYKGRCREERKYNFFGSVYEVIANEQKLEKEG